MICMIFWKLSADRPNATHKLVLSLSIRACVCFCCVIKYNVLSDSLYVLPNFDIDLTVLILINPLNN